MIWLMPIFFVIDVGAGDDIPVKRPRLYAGGLVINKIDIAPMLEQTWI